MRSIRWSGLVIAAAALLAACGDDADLTLGRDRSTTSAGPAGATRYEVTAMVLESPQHGPMLCLGAIALSLPPQCGDVDVVGWDWDAVEEEVRHQNGTIEGRYHVVGTYEDRRFTLTERPGPPEPSDPEPMPVFTSPCDPPAGGWAVADPALATDEALQATAVFAQAQPDYVGLWLDQSPNPLLADGIQPGEERVGNDPTKLVLNVRFTGEVERHARELREHWGGALCVSVGGRTQAELQAIQRELMEEDGFMAVRTDEASGTIHLDVVADDGLQERLDERYGRGLVRVRAALRPVEG